MKGLALLGKEPTVILYTLQGIAQAVQSITVPWHGTSVAYHFILALVIATIGAILNRAVVTPSQ